jgi:hypothetical protein
MGIYNFICGPRSYDKWPASSFGLATPALGFTQPLTEMSTGNIKRKKMFLGSKMRLVRGADNLTAIFESIV